MHRGIPWKKGGELLEGGDHTTGLPCDGNTVLEVLPAWTVQRPVLVRVQAREDHCPRGGSCRIIHVDPGGMNWRPLLLTLTACRGRGFKACSAGGRCQWRRGGIPATVPAQG